MPYMYILKCSDGSYYTGSTWNLEKRLAEHQAGLGANHTRKRLPVELVYCEECDRVEDAFRREKQIQGWSRKKKEALMRGDSNALHRLAECRNDTHYSGFGSAQPTVGPSTSSDQLPQPTVGPSTSSDQLAQTTVGPSISSDQLAQTTAGPSTSSDQLAQTTDTSPSLSEVEGSEATRSLSGVEGKKSP